MEHTGTCGTCHEPIEYRVISPSRANWVHTETGTWFGMLVEPHDCNTNPIRNETKS